MSVACATRLRRHQRRGDIAGADVFGQRAGDLFVDVGRRLHGRFEE